MRKYIPVQADESGIRVRRRLVIRGTRNRVPADAFVHDGSRAALQREPLRQNIFPSIVRIQRGAGPIGDRVAKSDDSCCAGRLDVDCLQPKHGRGASGELLALGGIGRSPAPFSVRNEVTTALLCWLGCASPDTNRLMARSSCAST